MFDITMKSTSAALVEKIANKSLQKQTVAMVKAVEAGKKSGWQLASACHAIKLLYTGKVANDITEQFPTIKEYSAFVGIDASAIHNNARAYQFMLDNAQVPMVTKKGNKTPSVNYDGFSLNVGQAEQLSRFTEEQLSAVKALAESQGFTLSDISVGKLKTFKKCGKFVEDAKPALDTKEQPKAESTKEQPKAESTKEQPKAESTKEQPKAESTKEQPKAESTKKPVYDSKNITPEQKLAIIDDLIDEMLLYGITIKDITAREQQRGKKA